MKSFTVVGLLVLACLAFHGPAVVDEWHPTWDSAVYLTLARNVASGDGYTYEGLPHVKYPPGFPVLLAPFAPEPGGSVLGARWLMVACAALWMMILFIGWRAHASDGVAFATALCAGLSFGVLLHTVRVLSDVPFLVPWTLSLFLGEKMRREPSTRNVVLWTVCFVLACSIRIVAIVQLPLLAWLMIRAVRNATPTRWRLGVALAVCVVFVGAWFARTALVRQSLTEDLRDVRSYEHEMETGESYEEGAEPVGIAGMLGTAVANLDHYRGLFGEAASAYVFPARTRGEIGGARDELGWWFGLLVSFVFLLGCFGPWRVREPWIVGAAVLYLVLVIFWPSRQGIRFLLPVYPLLYFVLVRRGDWIVTVVLLLFHLVPSLVAELREAPLEKREDWIAIYAHEHREPYEPPERLAFYNAGEWIAENLPDARVAAGDSALLVFRTGAHARSFPIVPRDLAPAERGKRLLESLQAQGVTHVLFIPQGLFAPEHLIAPIVAYVGLEKLAEVPVDPNAPIVPVSTLLEMGR